VAPSLPPEILDFIVDHLRDEPTTLKACCVVSKSWIHRTRKHLFASVEFRAPKSHIELWKKTFPDPSNSPAHHTRSLSIRGIPRPSPPPHGCGWLDQHLSQPRTLALGDPWSRKIINLPRPIPWIIAHPQITPSDLYPPGGFRSHLFLSPSRGSRVGFPSHGSDVWNTPSTSPKLTGSLDLRSFDRDPPYRTSTTGPPGWSPLHQDHGGVFHRRCRVDNGFSVEVF
jgi:hypothetical protein